MRPIYGSKATGSSETKSEKGKRSTKRKLIRKLRKQEKKLTKQTESDYLYFNFL